MLSLQHLVSEDGCILVYLSQSVILPSLPLLLKNVLSPLLELQLKLLNLFTYFSDVGL